ncbi:type II toxin-antitoxin system ParD family antitoxin [Blastopirellula retiformator]|uniref:Antitoxin ParD1 n=1 Tax=Blastopirellula retiformator TaxID=2527970 RepID=A0A5C5UZK9_9BACT|nr:type II toxin-antitoxin system ParD family antitoxin [Blastopirellula retiformator]TWT30917.1 hypothetical protein Enr8_44430 [Blastopirellula retiformator]
MNLTLPHELNAFVQSLVNQGRYSSAEEAVAAGIRLLQAQEALRLEIAKGIRQLDADESFSEEDVFAAAESAISKTESERT